MDITCNKCGKEYSLDETLVSSKGTAVRCTNCNHVFKAFKEDAKEEPDEWIIRKPHGVSLTVGSVSELKQWISEGKISQNDLLSKNSGPWKKIADIPELKQFFTKSRSRKAASAGFPRNEDSEIVSTIRRSPDPSSSNRGDFTARQVIFSEAPSSPFEKGDPDSDKENVKRTPSFKNAPIVNDKPTLPPRPVAPDDLENKTTINIAKGSISSSPPPPSDGPTTGVSLEHAVQFPDGNDLEKRKSADTPARKSKSTPSAEEMAAIEDPDLSQIPAVKDETEWNTGSHMDVPGPEWAKKTGSLPKYSNEKATSPSPKRKIGRLAMMLGILGILGAALLIYIMMPDTADNMSSRLAQMVSSSEQDRFQQFFDRGREKFLLDSENAYMQADREFQKVLALQQQHPATLAALGQMYGAWAQYLRDRVLDMEADTPTDAKKGPSENNHKLDQLKKSFNEKRQEALDWATRALRADPNLKEAHLAMADAKRLYGDLEPAEAQLEAAKSTGADAETRYTEVLIDMDNGAPADTLLKQLDEIISEKPLIRAMYRRARILSSQAKAEEARKELEHLFELNENHQAGRELVGRIAADKPVILTSKHPATAGAPPTGERSMKSPEKGKVSLKRGEKEEDVKYEKTVGEALESTNEKSLLLTAQKQLGKGKVSVAKESFKKVIEDSPNNVEALMGLAYCYLDQGNTGKAISYFRRALNNDPSSGAALIGLAETYKASGDQDQAIKFYRQYLEKYPGGKQAGMAKRNIDKLSTKPVERPAPSDAPAAPPAPGGESALPEPEISPKQPATTEPTAEEKKIIVVDEKPTPDADNPPPNEE